jgi:hypothetical protein
MGVINTKKICCTVASATIYSVLSSYENSLAAAVAGRDRRSGVDRRACDRRYESHALSRYSLARTGFLSLTGRENRSSFRIILSVSHGQTVAKHDPLLDTPM